MNEQQSIEKPQKVTSKSLTFQLDSNGKVLVFPVDNTGDSYPNEQKFNSEELEKVQQALFNVRNYPHLYGVTAIPFETQELKADIFAEDKTLPVITNQNIDLEKTSPAVDTFTIPTADNGSLSNGEGVPSDKEPKNAPGNGGFKRQSL